MRRTLCFLALLGLAASCQAAPSDLQTMGCTNCHAMNHQVLGPGWLQIAQRYRTSRNDPATQAALVKKVSRGGAGNWGAVPMVASDPAGIRQDQIRSAVLWVLHLPAGLPPIQAQK